MNDIKCQTGYPSVDKPWLKYYSDDALNTEIPRCTAYEYLLESNKDHLSNIALSYFGRKISFSELFSNIDRAAAAFQAIGIKTGDIVVFTTVTTPETIYAFYALNRLGAISNMVDPRTSSEGIRSYINEVNAETLITLDVAYPKIEEAIRGTGIKKVIVVSPSDSLGALFKILYRVKNGTVKLYDSCVLWRDFLTKGINSIKEVPYEENQCCLIVHTGGTTGDPKGVMLSNENINALVLQSILTEIDMQRVHTWMDIMPPFIAYGIGMGIHLPLVIGMETILVPSFDPKKFDELLIKYKPMHMVFVPSYWETIIKSRKLKNKDLSFIIAPTVGGDTMDTNLERAANEFLKEHGCNYRVTKGYGMTEVCAGVTGTLDANNEEGSVGVPFVKTVVSVFKPGTDEELQYGEIGEICITGPNTMLGYYDNEMATREIIRTHKDGNRWVHSGDIGYMNERGSLFIIDRIKRMIVRYDGFKIYPGVPSHYENVMNSPKMVKENLSYLISPIVGGDSMRVELENSVNEFLNNHEVKNNLIKGYGMTEVSAADSVCVSNECNKTSSVGIPFAHTIISVFNQETGEELSYNQKGEICMTGPNTMIGYYDNKEETERILRRHSDGRIWVHSGDLGYIDEDGCLFVEGRLKRMIVRYDGFKVYPNQIETVIQKNPHVRSCCAVGKDDNAHSQGRLPVVFVVIKEDSDVSQSDIRAQIQELCTMELPEYAQPKETIFIKELPLTPIGKVDYRVLEKLAEEQYGQISN